MYTKLLQIENHKEVGAMGVTAVGIFLFYSVSSQYLQVVLTTVDEVTYAGPGLVRDPPKTVVFLGRN